jgi:hypothetical protein
LLSDLGIGSSIEFAWFDKGIDLWHSRYSSASSQVSVRSRFCVSCFDRDLLLSAMGAVILHTFTQVTSATPIFSVDLQHWIIAFLVLTLTTNFTCTCMLVDFRATWSSRSSWKMSQVLLLVVFGGSIGQQQVELKDPTLLHQ